MSLNVTRLNDNTVQINDICIFTNDSSFRDRVHFVGQTRFLTDPIFDEQRNKNVNEQSNDLNVKKSLDSAVPPCLLSGDPDENLKGYLSSLIGFYFPYFFKKKELTGILHSWLTGSCWIEVQKEMASSMCRKKIFVNIICKCIYLWPTRHEKRTAQPRAEFCPEVCRVLLGQINCLHSCVLNFLFSDIVERDNISNKRPEFIVERLLNILFIHKHEIELLI